MAGGRRYIPWQGGGGRRAIRETLFSIQYWAFPPPTAAITSYKTLLLHSHASIILWKSSRWSSQVIHFLIILWKSSRCSSQVIHFLIISEKGGTPPTCPRNLIPPLPPYKNPDYIPTFLSQNPFSIMNSLRIFLLFALFSISLSHEPFNSHLLPRPLILEYPQESSEEIQLECTSWRFGVEANNLGPWKTIPVACAEYVKDYMTGRAYEIDLGRVANEAAIYARSVELSADGNDVWVFDVDETLLSNLPYYAEHGYG